MRRNTRVMLKLGHPRFGCSLLLAAIALILPSAAYAAPEPVAILTYHTHPPFITGDNEGLTYDLAEYLNKRAAGVYEFSVKPMSRPRLDSTLDNQMAAIVPWVNPNWFPEEKTRDILWSQDAVMDDGNAIVSRLERALVYDGPESLAGMVIGGIRGHRYTGIDDYAAENGSIRRIDADNHATNLRKLVDGYIDAMIAPDSAANYFIARDDLASALFISPTPHSEYERRVFVLDRRSDIMAFVDQVVAGLDADEDWTEIRRRYALAD